MKEYGMKEIQMGEIKRCEIGEAGYPARLKNIPDAPKVLYVLGELPEEEALSVAIVGARDCSEYGRFVAEELGRLLGSSGISVVSGMARGIDGISQTAALDGGGKSYGVLGCGVDICYPKENRRLYERLKANGGILSEYAPGTPAAAFHFPPRNRIVSGLADVVVVIEARAKSGTLITVDMALEQGREVYVVPGRVTDRLSDGCNRLLKQGAGILLSPEEFLTELLEREAGKAAAAELGRRRDSRRKPKRAESAEETENEKGTGNAGLSPELSAVLKALDYTPGTVEQIRSRLPKKYQDKQIITYLMELCMEKHAVQVSPGSFALAGG